MPSLEEVSYSEAACVAAISKYFKFLIAMYVDEDEVEWPPEGGWPMVTKTAFGSLDKSDGVISLLKHLPYFRESNFVESSEVEDPAEKCGIKLITESFLWDRVTSHIIGLTEGGRDYPFILLDTEQGVIYWPECDDDLRDDTTQEQIEDDPYAWAPEDEANWRNEAPAWAIGTFFEMLEEQFLNLRFLPINSRQVITDYTQCSEDGEMEDLLKAIYREHGWPDLEHYEKEKCLKAVERAMQERYPEFSP